MRNSARERDGDLIDRDAVEGSALPHPGKPDDAVGLVEGVILRGDLGDGDLPTLAGEVLLQQRRQRRVLLEDVRRQYDRRELRRDLTVDVVERHPLLLFDDPRWRHDVVDGAAVLT